MGPGSVRPGCKIKWHPETLKLLQRLETWHVWSALVSPKGGERNATPLLPGTLQRPFGLFRCNYAYCSAIFYDTIRGAFPQSASGSPLEAGRVMFKLYFMQAFSPYQSSYFRDKTCSTNTKCLFFLDSTSNGRKCAAHRRERSSVRAEAAYGPWSLCLQERFP